MNIFFYLVVFGTVMGCVTKHPSSLDTVPPLTVQAVKPKSCDTINRDCPQNDSVRVFCKAYHDKGISTTWANSPCLGAQYIYDETCRLGITPLNVGDIKCIPDPSQGECPYSPKFCTYEFKPSRCRATYYGETALPKKFQLVGGGANPCTAQQELMDLACKEGLIPSKLGGIKCEEDFTAGECPPNFSCSTKEFLRAECEVSSFGKQKLIPQWVAKASSECEARYRLKVRACRFANASNKLKPSLLGDIKCKESSP